MSLAPLATLDDVAARMPRALTNQETARVPALLTDASTAVRRYARQTFTKTSTTRDFRPVDNQIILADKPVISIDSLSRVGPDGKTLMPYAIWTFDGIDRIMLGPPSMLVNAPEVWTDVDWFWRNVTYNISYTHGYDVIPDDVVGVTAGAVVRVLLAPGGPGVVSESIGQYTYRVQDGYPTAVVALNDTDREILRPYRSRRNRTLELK